MAKKLIRRGSAMPPMTPNSEYHGDIQSFIRSQIYFKGYKLGVSAGPNPNLSVQLGGDARRLYGIVLFIQNDKIANDDLFSLTINNETIITDVIWRAFNPSYSGNFKTQIFFDIPRPLSGNDNVIIGFNAAQAMNIYPVFYLSNTTE